MRRTLTLLTLLPALAPFKQERLPLCVMLNKLGQLLVLRAVLKDLCQVVAENLQAAASVAMASGLKLCLYNIEVCAIFVELLPGIGRRGHVE